MAEPVAPAAAMADVAILGGGLAGLSLAIQLRRRNPGMTIRVIERRAPPAPEAAFKVGESTVEIGAHYFAHVLGLRAHLDSQQIRKFGFRFFFSDRQRQIADCTELGVSQPLPTPSWQLDRGRFENFLQAHARTLGVDVIDAASVRAISLGEDDAPHRLRYRRGGQEQTLAAHWLVDASGRAGLLKRKLGLAESNEHAANAVWWRVDGCLDPGLWSDDPAWRARCTPPERWRSTNHLCGPGYWVWMIPLASGAHSLGIVCDARMHRLETMNTHAKAMDWLRRHQPQAAAMLERPQHALRDFHFLRQFSYGCKQVFSPRRWALTGEAGLFLDPFYSPGSDFIAISNGYICNLIEKSRNGSPIDGHAAIYQQLYFSFYRNTMPLYQGQYPLFGDAQLMPIKVIWDYTYYWALLAPLYFADKLTDLPFLGRLRSLFQRGSSLNQAMQRLLRNWSQSGRQPPAHDRRMLDQFSIDWFHQLNQALTERLDDDALYQRLAANVERMGWLAAEILERAECDASRPATAPLRALLPAAGPRPPSLPPNWYGDAADPDQR